MRRAATKNVVGKRHVLVAVMALGALAACGSPAAQGGGGTQPEVATLASAGAAPSASPSSARPRYRLDMTAEDRDALMVPYYKCLKDHGYSVVDAKRQMDSENEGQPASDKKAQELRACEQQYYPLPEWERDPSNPKAGDFQRAVTACLKAKGVKMEGDAFADDNGTKGLELSPECERKAAAEVD